MKERLRQTKDHAKQLLEIAKRATGTSDSEELPSELKLVRTGLDGTAASLGLLILGQSWLRSHLTP